MKSIFQKLFLALAIFTAPLAANARTCSCEQGMNNNNVRYDWNVPDGQSCCNSANGSGGIRSSYVRSGSGFQRIRTSVLVSEATGFCC